MDMSWIIFEHQDVNRLFKKAIPSRLDGLLSVSGDSILRNGNTVCPPVISQFAIEHGDLVRGFTYKTWWFSIAMLVHQRVCILYPPGN
jgi:hypothetical protein